MAGVAERLVWLSPQSEGNASIAQWRIRPRQLGALLRLRWKLGIRVYRRSISALIGLVVLLIFTLGAAAVVGTLTAAGYLNLQHAAAVELLFGALGLLYIVWIVLPALQYSVNEGLDVSKLHTYPITLAERMTALTVSTLFDPATLIILSACAAVVIGWHATALATVLTVVALAFLYVHIVGASQFALAMLVGLLRSRRYRDLSVIAFALMSVACSLSGQFMTVLLGHVRNLDFLSRLDLGKYVQFAPPGMAAQAIIAANTGNYLTALLWLLALIALTPVLLTAWAWVLDRGVTSAEGGGATPRRRRFGARTAQSAVSPRLSLDEAATAATTRRRLISPVVSAIAVKDLRYFWRDPQIKASLLSSLVLLFVVFAPSLTHRQVHTREYFWLHLSGLQPVLAPLPALLIVLSLSLNAFGLERQGLQQLLLTPAKPRDILWGKNLAVGIVAFTAQVALILIVAAMSGDWNAVPLALIEGVAAMLALMGTGNVTSVLAPLRVRQLRMGSNNLSSESGCLRSVISLLTLWGTLFLLLPVFVLLLLPPLVDHREFWVVTAPVALLYGLALYQVATLLIAPRLLKRAPEILSVVAREA